MASPQDIQRLVVTFEARLTKFEKDMAKALGIANKTAKGIESRFDRMEKKLSAVGRNMRGFVAAIAGSAAIRSFGQAIDKIANIGEIAGRIGVTTEALQAMYAIAKRTGASLEEMDRALQGIAEQSAESGSFLQKLFAANQKPISQNVEDNLRTVMDLLKNARNEQERLAIATGLWGDRLGRGLVEAFAKGPGALDQMFADLTAAGQAHSDAQIKEAQKIRDAWRLYTDQIALYFQKGIITMLEATGVFGTQTAEKLEESIAAAKATLTTLLATRDAVIMGEGGWGAKSPEQLSIEIGLVEQKLREMRAALKALKAEAGAPATSTGTTVLPPATTRGEGPGREAIELDDTMVKLIQDMDDARDAAKGFTSDLVSGLREGLSLTESLGQAFENLADKIIDKLLDQAIGGLLGETGTAQSGLLGQLLGVSLKDQSRLGGGGAPDVLGGTAPIIPVVSKVLDTVAKQAADGWKEIAREPLPPEVDLTGGAADAAGLGLGAAVPVVPVVQSLLKSVARHPAYEQIAPSAVTPDVLLDLMKLFSRIPGFGIGGGARAEGGPVARGGAYVVGEKGPELFMPRTPGIVMPNAGAGGNVGGLSVQVLPSRYFDVRVARTASRLDAGVLRTGSRSMPSRMASFSKLGT